MPFAGGPILTYVGLGQYQTVGQTVYVGSKDLITIPDGFRTDLATVPRLFWVLLPPQGAYEKAAVLHDHGCVELAAGTCAMSSRDVDGLFRRVMRENGVGPVVRWLMWTGVRWGALANPARRRGWLRDAPAVLALSFLALAASSAVVYGADHAVHTLIDLLTR